MSPPQPPRVLIVGCGIAGLVLANFYKRKGYSPTVFERVNELGDVGASLMLMPNGMKVLDLVGIAVKVKQISTPLVELRDATADGKELGGTDLPATWAQKHSQPAIGTKRTTLNLLLRQMLDDLEIEVRQGWELTDIVESESENSVTATFNEDRKVTGAFLVGCDGIKAASRRILLQSKGVTEDDPVFTGLTQTAGISPTPSALRSKPGLRNWYGKAAHVIAYPISHTHTSWAITLPETKESEEVWRLYIEAEREALKEGLVALLEGWTPELEELVNSAERIVKFGTFDRPELTPAQWEDCYHLSHSMPMLAPDSPNYVDNMEKLGDGLSSIFSEYAEKRQPRTSTLVNGARSQGESRVVTDGPEACRQRDRNVTAAWKDTGAIAAKYDNLCREPF